MFLKCLDFVGKEKKAKKEKNHTEKSNIDTHKHIEPKIETSYPYRKKRNLTRDFKESRFFKPLCIFATIIFLGIFLEPFFVSGVFIAIGVLSRMHQKYLKFPIGVDMAVFGAVVSGAAFGPFFGAVVGFFSYFISVFFTDENPQYTPPALLGITIVGIAAGLIGIVPANIVFYGIALTVFYNMFTGAIYFYLYKASLIGGFAFLVTHVWFNYVVFSIFGEAIISIL